jgi:hypothetical protein
MDKPEFYNARLVSAVKWNREDGFDWGDLSARGWIFKYLARDWDSGRHVTWLVQENGVHRKFSDFTFVGEEEARELRINISSATCDYRHRGRDFVSEIGNLRHRVTCTEKKLSALMCEEVWDLINAADRMLENEGNPDTIACKISRANHILKDYK